MDFLVIFIPDCYEASHTAPPPGLRLSSAVPPNNTHKHTEFTHWKSALFASQNINNTAQQK